jgi:hypothetical protein
LPEVVIEGDVMSATVRVGVDDVAINPEPNIGAFEAVDDEPQGREVKMTRLGVNGRVVVTDATRAAVETGSGVTTLAEGYVDGLRMFEVIDGKNSAHKFTYGISIDGSDASFLQQEDGSILVGWGSTNDFTAIGQIDAPWAFDANGEPVGASYKVVANGSRLVLSVDRAGEAAYPVTADPSFTSWVGEVHCSWGSCTFYLERVKTYWVRDVFATKSFAVASAMVGSALCGWIVAGTSFTGVGAFFVGIGCAAYIASVIYDVDYHSDQGWSCLTFKKGHWSTWITVGHASGSSSHCHYNA